MNEEDLHPSIEYKMNIDEIKRIEDEIAINIALGSPVQRKQSMRLNLLKKLAKKQLDEYNKNKRRNSRFA